LKQLKKLILSSYESCRNILLPLLDHLVVQELDLNIPRMDSDELLALTKFLNSVDAPVTLRWRVFEKTLSACGWSGDLGNKVEHVFFTEGGIDAKSVEVLRIHQNLKSLFFNRCSNFGDDGAVALARSLANNTTLVELTVINCDIGSVGIVSLCDALCMSTVLRVLRVPNNRTGDAGLNGLAKLLRRVRTLEVADLSHNGLMICNDDFGRAVASSSLKELYLNWNGCASANLLFQNLGTNSCLKILGMDRCDVSDCDWIALGCALQTNRALKSVVVGCASVSSEAMSTFVTMLRKNRTILWIGFSTRDYGAHDPVMRIIDRNKAYNNAMMLVCARKFVSSDFDVMPKEIVKMIAKMVWDDQKR
jgi:hypothetical protein